ncbi:MAG TPA: prolyl oligopeptidase family serine peptidase [Streptosporangiaceae bacterium]|jgi:dipeptidyl-peptidase-4|nr:prolyl oligopeptidase family serine peptidase [Streptosporangiaceae bacterium]
MKSNRLPAQILRTRRFTLGVPTQFTVALGGAVVLFLRSRAGDDPVRCLWALDLDSGTERPVADPAQLLGPSPAGQGISGYATGRDGELTAFALAGQLWTVAAGAPARQLPARGPVADPRPDPRGRRIAYISDGALRVIHADGSGDQALLTPGRNDGDVVFGLGQEAGALALDGERGFWWAPDGERLLVARVDSTAVPVHYIADPADPAKPPRAIRYPAAGTLNPEVTLWIAGLDGTRTQVRWDREAFEYVPRAGWDTNGPYAVVQSRDQRTVRFLAISPAAGQTAVLSEQRDACWVQLVPGLPGRTQSGTLVAHADLAGTRHLTLDGVPVTPPGLQLRAGHGIEGEQVLFTASDDPAETHLWTYSPADGPRRLTRESGQHSGLSRDGTLVCVAAGAGQPGGRATASRAGQPAIHIPTLAERPVLAVRATRLMLGPARLRADLYLPSWYRPADGRLPVLADPYGGASRQRVTAELEWRDLVSQWFAEQGFAVLVTDGRGTPGRGPGWEREVYGDPLGPVLEDQVAALHEAARLRPELDLTRVGIRGWSFSGTLAALAVLRRPDVFHAAVAGAAVTDQHLHNARWRERFLGHPDQFPDRYAANSLIDAAPSLTRPLLLIHGLADDNVPAANTLRLSRALLAAGRPHEVLLLPGAGHASMGPGSPASLLAHQASFLQQSLGSGSSPP